MSKEISVTLPQKIIDGVQRWCIENKMRLNISKCKVMVVSKQTISVAPVTIKSHSNKSPHTNTLESKSIASLTGTTSENA
jgi:hypothetical protein